MKRKALLLIITVVICGNLYGCIKKTTPPELRYDQIFNINSSLNAFNEAELLFSLPEGASLYYTGTTAKDYSKAYIENADVFIA